MADFEKNHESIELTPDALEQAVGGAGRSLRALVVTRQTYLREGPGKNYNEVVVVRVGDELYYSGLTKADERGVNWYGVVAGSDGFTLYISSKCCKFA